MDVPADRAPAVVEFALGGMIRIGARRVPVADVAQMLSAIARTGSVQGVAAELDLSYRAAWERLRALEDALGIQLIRKTRGHGTVLTEAGSALQGGLAAAAAGVAGALARETRALQRRIDTMLGGALARITVAASHDPLLMEALSEWPDCEVVVAGSAEAVARLSDGRADAAGFHCGALAPAQAGHPFAEIAGDPGFVLRPLFDREQGLILAAGNPLGIAGVGDLAGTSARYVNRQRGSGTRVWFDRLLAGHDIAPGAIRGYGTEEFTHQAVAAVIACGAADAGLGARAAADRFGLFFLPVGWETYYLAVGATLPPGPAEALAARVAERALRTAGYRPSEA